MNEAELAGAIRVALELGIGIVLAGGAVALLLNRWKRPTSRAARTWRVGAITVVAVLVALAWPLAIMLGIIAASIGFLGRPSRRPSAVPQHYTAQPPHPRGHNPSPATRRSPEDNYWDQRAREERDHRFAAQYEADMYRWGHRHHPPPGY